MAIVLPVLFLLVFGIVEFGIAWFDKQSISNGVREAARQGIVTNYDDGTGCSGAGGSLDQLACQAGKKIDVGDVGVLVTGGGDRGEQLTVCAKVTYQAITGYLNPFLDGRELVSSVTMRMEQDGASGSATWTEGAGTAPAAEECT